MASYIKNRIYP